CSNQNTNQDVDTKTVEPHLLSGKWPETKVIRADPDQLFARDPNLKQAQYLSFCSYKTLNIFGYHLNNRSGDASCIDSLDKEEVRFNARFASDFSIDCPSYLHRMSGYSPGDGANPWFSQFIQEGDHMVHSMQCFVTPR
ncbi:MAG TPA: hypothetical protein VFW62_04885, partial [bacterium]|nr:hypothetical protein [bacterium]